jgi:hypothetical protein
MLLSNLKCSLNLHEIDPRSSDWSIYYYSLTIFLKLVLSFLTKENALCSVYRVIYEE